ncbi:S8 family peptidase [Streptomyces somaliensis DSM 40738]|uniref:S8 family peptidase n=1 Tax=Streptomyces somaliensis TaxID=78355 RepID=UPI0021C2AEFE|nr:S8 family peptidase [Streptomyces somaliensis]MCQ0022867.1 S8 family peptidase [Streptomyces somaliensis DSM 40738]
MSMTLGFRWRAVVTVAAAALALTQAPAGAAPAAEPAPRTGAILGDGGPGAIDGAYIVVLRESAVTSSGVGARAMKLADAYGGTVTRTYQDALHGFGVRMSREAARRLAADPVVSYVEQDRTVRTVGTQTPTPSWGLDRVDQRALPLDDSYTYPNTAAGVRVYILDTGVRATHTDFGGRVVGGRDIVDNDDDPGDCNGHGTHVAGTAAGTSHGIAKGATVVPVRIMDCGGRGAWSDVIAGIEWVTADHDPGEPTVANMSIGGGTMQSVNDAVAAAIGDGVTFVVAAGNDNADACRTSPASTPEAITIGATDEADRRASFSNHGTCLDLFAPGVGITSAWYTGDTATTRISGTSMAAPHAAGLAAVVTAAHPSYTPQQVRDAMVADATAGVVTNPGTGSPNKLLHLVRSGPVEDDFSVTVDPSNVSLEPGAKTTLTVGTSTVSGAPQQVALSVAGLPAGAKAAFDVDTVTSGESAALTVATDATVPAGVHTVTVTGTGTGEGVARTASFSLTVTAPAGGCDKYPYVRRGTLATGGSAYQPEGGFYHSAVSARHEGCLDGPDAANYDLYLQKWGSQGWATVAQSVASGADEKLTYAGTSGYYRYRVHAVSGSGAYTFGYVRP